MALIFACSHSFALEAVKPQPPSIGKTANQNRRAAKASEKGAEALPCPRATYKDDPICFGADDKDALPVPSGTPVAQERPTDGIKIRPATNLNSRPTSFGPYQAGVVYQSNGNAVTNNYSGGVKMELPF